MIEDESEIEIREMHISALKERINTLELILKTCTVDCCVCGNQEDADGDLEDWRLSGGEWLCPDCREKEAKERADEEKYQRMREEKWPG